MLCIRHEILFFWVLHVVQASWTSMCRVLTYLRAVLSSICAFQSLGNTQHGFVAYVCTHDSSEGVAKACEGVCN